MTYEDLQVYVNNQYTNATWNGMLSSDVIIDKSDYFNLLEICREWKIRCYPFVFGFNCVLLNLTKEEDNHNIKIGWVDGVDNTSDNLIRVILEWDEPPEDEAIIFTWDDSKDEDEDEDDEDNEESE